MVHNAVTDKKRAANRSNGAQSHGPSTEEGKERAKMNAFKHGHDAARPDAAALLDADLTEPEAAEREALREETRRSYASWGPASSESGPADDFALAEATELADLRYELVRLERVRAAVLERERELLELEERCRRHQRRHGDIEATLEPIQLHGLWGLPDSPAKWRECLYELALVAKQFARHEFNPAKARVRVLYGEKDPLWRGVRMWNLALVCLAQGPGAVLDSALARLQSLVAKEMEAAQAALELSEREQEPLSAAGQTARLAEAMASRRWSWLRQQENFLRRSIDRKVRILLELRKQGAGAGVGGRFDSAPDRQRSGGREKAKAPTPADGATGSAGFEAASGEGRSKRRPYGPTSATPRRDGDGEKKSAKRRNEPTKSNKINNATPTPDGPDSERTATTVPPQAAAAPQGPEGA